jgi:hypothetical protein
VHLAPFRGSNSWEVWRAATGERERDVMGHRQKTEDWLAWSSTARVAVARGVHACVRSSPARCQSVAALPRHGHARSLTESRIFAPTYSSHGSGYRLPVVLAQIKLVSLLCSGNLRHWHA